MRIRIKFQYFHLDMKRYYLYLWECFYGSLISNSLWYTEKRCINKPEQRDLEAPMIKWKMNDIEIA